MMRRATSDARLVDQNEQWDVPGWAPAGVDFLTNRIAELKDGGCVVFAASLEFTEDGPYSTVNITYCKDAKQ